MRGELLAVPSGDRDNLGALVLTNDVWNGRMRGVAAVPVRDTSRIPMPAHGVPVSGRGWADPFWLAHIKRERLERGLYIARPDELARLEDALVELLALRDLCAHTPMAPHSPSGPVNYARWGDMYWLPNFEPEAGEAKRYVVVSHDHHNRRRPPLVVRTTSQAKHNLVDFPSIQGGGYHACPGEVTVAPTRFIEMGRRPDPSELSIPDMAAVARGIAATLSLEPAVRRAGGDI